MSSKAAATKYPPRVTVATRPVVLVCDKLDPDGVALLEAAGVEVRVQVGMTPEQILEAAADADGILVRSASKIPAEALAAGAGRLRAVGRAGIGVDNIDVAAASRHGVLVMNTPTANAVTTGELALAHLFALARRIPEADASMKAGRWDKSKLVGAEITGKTLAVFGLGKIGRVVAERALGLQMRVIAHDPFLQGDSPLPGVTLVGFDEALTQADFVSIHVPKGKDTAGLFDADALAKLKPGAYLINCARGGIVDEAALMAALDSGHLAGAALDVYSSEPLAEDSPLRKQAGLTLTPHLGASSDEAQKRVSLEIAQQMADYLLKGEARSAVNAPALTPDQLAVLRPWLSLGRRCGLLLAQTAGEPIARVEIDYVGNLALRPTDAVKLEVIAGLLQPSLDGPVNAVNAGLLATERGLKVLEEKEEQGSEYAALLKIVITTASGSTHSAAGTVFRGEPRLVLFDGFGVDFVPKGDFLLTRHTDAPGVLAQVAGYLGGRNINIAGLHMGAPPEGRRRALALYGISRALTDTELEDLALLPPIAVAQSLSLDG
ncbi:MAG: phosphoglycerate dehydrogenase [Planctomycetota bacterium]|jgi:D-3-phosphoglycerate dehydrogenase